MSLHELRRDAVEVLRRVESGERVEITVSGRPRAVLVPAESRRWRSWSEVVEVFAGPPDLDRDTERDHLDEQLRDPWADQH